MLKDHTVRPFDLSIALQVQARGIINLDYCIFTEVFELPHSKLGPIIDVYVVGDAEPVHVSKMNCIALATVMKAVSFASIHLVNLSTATKMCVNMPLTF
jgi:hypothetical protein